jgi:hypothetical protein
MLRTPYVPGLAMTAHLKASSLCDMVLAIVPYFVASEELCTQVEDAIGLARRAADVRNTIIHGPFDFFGEGHGSKVGRLTARSKLKFAETAFDLDALKAALALHIEAWQAVADCYVGMCALAEERDRLGLPPLRPDFAQKASHQTEPEPTVQG